MRRRSLPSDPLPPFIEEAVQQKLEKRVKLYLQHFLNTTVIFGFSLIYLFEWKNLLWLFFLSSSVLQYHCSTKGPFPQKQNCPSYPLAFPPFPQLASAAAWWNGREKWAEGKRILLGWVFPSLGLMYGKRGRKVDDDFRNWPMWGRRVVGQLIIRRRRLFPAKIDNNNKAVMETRHRVSQKSAMIVLTNSVYLRICLKHW